MGCTIIGCGKQLPALDVPNEELTKLVDTSDEWISTRTGILSRRVCVGEGNVDLAEGAARQALGWADGGYSQRKIAPEDIDLIIYSTITPDEVVPTCAAVLRRRLGLVNAAAFDMNAACSGFIYGLTIAETMMSASAPGAAGAAGRNPIDRALVVGGERSDPHRRLEPTATHACCSATAPAPPWWSGTSASPASWPGTSKTMMTTTNALTCPACLSTLPQPFTPEGVDPNASAAGRPRHRPHRCRARRHGARRRYRVLRARPCTCTARRCSSSPPAPCPPPSRSRCAAPRQPDHRRRAVHRARIRRTCASSSTPPKRMGLPLERFQASIAHRRQLLVVRASP